MWPPTSADRQRLEGDDGQSSGQWWLLIRRNDATGELAYYRWWPPALVPLRELVRVAPAVDGRSKFQAGKTLTRLDQHQVRQWTSWRRWTILAMLAFAGLAGLAAAERALNPTPQRASLIALTCNEIHRLFNTYIAEPIRDLPAALVNQATPTSTPRQNQPLPARTSDKRTAGCGPGPDGAISSPTENPQFRHHKRPEQVQFPAPPQVAFALLANRVSARFMVTWEDLRRID